MSPYPSCAHPTTFIAGQAENFIRKFQNKNPWFVFCSFMAPHHPFEAPQEQIDRYELGSIPLPDYKQGVEKQFIPPPASEAIGIGEKYPQWVQRKIIQHYFASISLVDDCVGKLIRTLEQTGQIENTVIVFTSDHGQFLGNHGLLRKPSLHYDELLRVPLVIKLPGSFCAGRKIDGLVELVDVYPTLAGFLGLAVNSGVQGTDWSENIIAGVGKESIYADMFDIEPLFGSPFGPYMAVMTLRTEQWKINVYPTAGIRYGQLFNLKQDPGETRNLYAETSLRQRKEELLWHLIRKIHLMSDPLPLCLSQY